MPAVTNPQFPAPWETGPSAADPALSASFGSYTGPGYAGNGYVAVGQGTINVGAPVTVTPGPQAAQVRFYVGSDGNLYALDNRTGLTWKSTTPGGPVQPGNYTQTK